MRWILGGIEFSAIITITVISVVSAIHLPALGWITAIYLLAFLIDANRKYFGRYLIPISHYWDLEESLGPWHRTVFFCFTAAMIMNTVLTGVRWTVNNLSFATTSSL